MELYLHRCRPLGTNSYLIACQSTKNAFLVDPGLGSFRFFSSLIEEKGYQLQAIVLTHSHWDHIAEVALCCRSWSVPLWVHREDGANIREPGADGLVAPIPIEGWDPSRWLEEGDRLQVGKQQLTVLHTPGHSPGGICLYSAPLELLFSGDTLFKGSYGSLSLPTAEPERMVSSLARLAGLPPETRVYPGHGPSTTIGAEASVLSELSSEF